MFCAGLTGGVGAGKSAAAEMFAARGVLVVDADTVGRDLTAAGGAGVSVATAALGEWAAAADGGLNRQLIRGRIFSDPDLRRKLEAALHPLIRAESLRCLSAAAGSAPYGMLSAPLLLESGVMAELCDRIAVVDCDLELQIARAASRDGVDAEDIRRIAAAQMPRRERLARADDVLENSGTLAELEKRVAELHRKYEGLARQ